MTFTGWPRSAIPFFEGLEADNSRDYWQAHKSVYDGDVRAPIEALTADLAAEFGPAVLFRPYRDVRFSADKSPYKTQVAAVLGDTGDGAYYLQLSADGLMTGAGLHVMTPDQVARLRAAIDEERSGAALESIVARLRDTGFEQGGDSLKTAPRGVGKDHPRIGLLRYRSCFVLRHHRPAGWLHTAKARDVVREDWLAARPLVDWLHEHVGPSAAP
ncbi:MAG TPA: DUF2461 domain-containing protein [Mycobacteriales bacterium]|nr:DUF2461 domain-containing protein [Mycobacteriales bacterium]